MAIVIYVMSSQIVLNTVSTWWTMPIVDAWTDRLPKSSYESTQIVNAARMRESTSQKCLSCCGATAEITMRSMLF